MSGVAIVTGAARGIGAATVLALARADWQVVAVDMCRDDVSLPYALASKADLEAVVAQAGSAVACDTDVRDEAALRNAVGVAEEAFGGLDVAIAVAGVIAGGVPLWEMPGEQLSTVFDVDLGGVVGLARASVPAMLRRSEPRSGRFIAVASAAATSGMPNLAGYCAAKAGVTGLIRGLAADLRGTGVTANAVSPGSTATAILDESARLYGLDSAEEFAAQQPLERLLEPEEVAAMLAWLAGPDASGLTGATIPVDGGLSL